DIQSFIVDLDFEPTNIYFNPFYDIISQWQKKELKFTKKNYIIYPNPAKNNISLLFKDSIGEYSLKIYGENGVSYIKKDGLAENELNINISNIKSGAYIIELKLDNEIIKTKFVKN
ncbi:MAG: T9SS type A sorting domain-containing protein, partial [Bacteroidales bacterium]|nr:T9SS type A sorting domain-containing protein [Bacteroidales bacterium]